MAVETKKEDLFLKGVAWFISYAFHPSLMPTWLFIFLINFTPVVLNPINAQGRKSLLLVIFISTCALPVLILLTLMLIMKREFSIKDLFMTERSERIFPFFFTGFYFFALTYTLFDQFGKVLFVIMQSISVLILVLAIITIFWKVSAHSAGVGGGLGILLMIAYLFSGVDFLIPVLLITLLGGMVLTSRLFLQAHNVAQAYGGFIIGLLICFCASFISFIL